MKRSTLGKRGNVLKTLTLAATFAGVVAAGCTDEPLDLRPTLGGGEAGKAGEQPGGAVGGQPPNGNDAGADTGGQGGANDGGVDAGGSAGKGGGGKAGSGTGETGGTGGTGGKAGSGGTGGTGGTSGSGGTTPVSSCGDGNKDVGEECDDHNKLSGDGCSFDCKSACETCESVTCPAGGTALSDSYAKAYGIEGEATKGPAVGVPRSELLRDLLKCVYQSKCTVVVNSTPDPVTAQITLRQCACANPATSPDPASVPVDCNLDDKIIKGPCYRQMIEAAEADTNPEMYTRMANRNYAVGLAFSLLQYCDAKVCSSQCIPTEAAATVCTGTCE